MRRVGLTLIAGITLTTSAVLVGGCGSEPSLPASDRPPSQEQTVSASPSPPASPFGSTTGGRVQQAVADLAAHQGADPGHVEVVSVEEVTWRDGSLGCAKPGVAYTQALVPGTRIVLALDGRQYEYHAGGRTAPFRCDRPTQ